MRFIAFYSVFFAIVTFGSQVNVQSVTYVMQEKPVLRAIYMMHHFRREHLGEI